MRNLIFATFAISLVVPASGEARPFRPNHIPNGADQSCNNCHVVPGGPRNPFGLTIFDRFLVPQDATGLPQWGPELAALDSDDDGYTNGEELGDPLGLWSFGDADPDFLATSPGRPEENPCGNRTLEGPEQCDGSTFGDDATCQDLGFAGGEIACTTGCELDESDCNNIVCGDNTAEDTELCDGTDLAGETCQTRGFDDGELACQAGCFFDDSACRDFACGDGIVEGAEACDSDDLGGATCISLGFEGGGELACDNTTCGYNTAACIGDAPPICGDRELEGDEECDGALFGDATCESLGFDAGDLACSNECLYVVNGCTTFECGNNITEGDETCDGADLGDQTCADFGFDGGELACGDECEIDTSGCENTQPGDEDVEPTPDAGTDAGADTVEPDAGTDAGADTVEPDAGTDAGTDTTVEPDAGTDTGVTVDVGIDVDGSSNNDGCAAAPAAPGALWMLLGLLGLRRRRA
ncbi:MAG: hypothetical protein ACI81R_001621 [Bradymonadia bacterium]